MFGIGLPELAVIAFVAVIVFGPERLPEFARQAGRFVRQMRNLANTAQPQLREELGPEAPAPWGRREELGPGSAALKPPGLDPRRAIRKPILGAMGDDFDEPAPLPSY